MSLFYGLTGGIGSGKSTVVSMFSARGVPTLDLDAVGKGLLQTEATLLPALVAAFGTSILDAQQQLVRAKLAAVAFASAEQTATLNAITHPYILDYEKHWRAQQDAPFCIIEASVLIESDDVSRMDGLIVVLAEMQQRQQRVLARQQQNLSTFAHIVQQQCSDDERSKHADFTIKNNGTMQALAHQVQGLLQALGNGQLVVTGG